MHALDHKIPNNSDRLEYIYIIILPDLIYRYASKPFIFIQKTDCLFFFQSVN